MAIYDGSPIQRGAVSLHTPDVAAVDAALASADLAESQWIPWHIRAGTDDAIVYFSASDAGRLVGQIMLHDIDREQSLALVGYHIFRAADRGRGIGSTALSMLRDYAFAEEKLQRLIAITGVENAASQRIAEKCGFARKGAAREGAHLVVYERLCAAG